MKRTEKVHHDYSKDFVFQLLSWSACDEEYGDEDDDGTYDVTKYLIKAYGCTAEGHSVSLNILNFTPFFYIKIPHRINRYFPQALREYIVSKLPWQLKNTLSNIKILQRKDFWGFSNFEKFNFARLTFTNLKGYRACIRLFNFDVKIPGVHSTAVRYKLYESNIEPFLRFMHIQDLQPAGWCVIPAGKHHTNSGVQSTTCQYDLECDWKSVKPYENDILAPYIIASFDIECTSSHGDFPVAKKDYKKVANELVTMFFDNAEMNADDLRALVSDELLAIFTAAGGKHMSKVYPKNSVSIESLQKIIQKHLDDIINILCGKVVYKNDGKKVSRESIANALTRKFGTYDLVELDRKKEKKWVGIFPPLKGDNIIQIGTTVHVYGEKECSYKNIITLGTCDAIEGVDVIQCETEEDLLLKWRDLVVSLDPDVLLGYNIFGFDMSYMQDRADELGVAPAFSKLGRICNKECKFEEKMLSSSALGDNILKYYDMDGRVIIDIMKVVQRDHKLDSFKLDNVAHHFIGLKKNDVHPNDIFRLQKGSSSDRKVIAEYCVQDCALCNLLTMKLETLANNIGMANVCSVPLSYIFMRGQGIKIFSLVAKECRLDDFLIPTIYKGRDVVDEDDDGYEGAIVLEPKTGIYIEDPICVLDYASLYPSSMISENLSHDCIVIDAKYDNLPGVEYLEISYDLYGEKKQKIGEKVCKFVQLPNNEKGIIPRTLQKLLGKRKETRKKIEWKTVTLNDGSIMKGMVDESASDTVKIAMSDGRKVEVEKATVVSIEDSHDDFQKAILDGLQTAYKVTANSLYGQIGARTSQIYMKDIAACTTATGRKMIMLAKDYIEKNNDQAEIIYGDTDSLFIKFHAKNEFGEKLKGKEAIPKIRELGIKNSKEIQKLLKPPHDLEWEKIFYPFILLSKKRYVANKYEWDDNKCKQNSMGIVLKRRDNANIVKKIYGGIIETILNQQDVGRSLEFLTSSIKDVLDGRYPMEDFVVTKSLRADYKDPDRIAHKMLADRMKERDPGNAPNVNDRIPYAYVQMPAKPKGVKTLQGERIETPDYIKQNSLKIDYEFYITNQIMNPVLQVYALVLDQLPGYDKDESYWKEMYEKVFEAKEQDMKKTKERMDALKENEVKRLLFEPLLHPPNDALPAKKKVVRKATSVKKPVVVTDGPKDDVAPVVKRGRKSAIPKT